MPCSPQELQEAEAEVREVARAVRTRGAVEQLAQTAANRLDAVVGHVDAQLGGVLQRAVRVAVHERRHHLRDVHRAPPASDSR